MQALRHAHPMHALCLTLAAFALLPPQAHAQTPPARTHGMQAPTLPPQAVEMQAPTLPPQAATGDYAGMLDYLGSSRVDSRIDGRAFGGASGAIGVNLAAGDLNLQANLRSIAVGDYADAGVDARQFQSGNRFDAPLNASASIGGRAFEGASGLLSINQASGSGNAEMNVIAMTLANQGIREATDGQLWSVASASAGGRSPPDPNSVARLGTRSVAVESTALHGFEGVLQLNQVAGSGNATGNQLSVSLPLPP